MGQAFVSDPAAISRKLVSVIREKACLVTVFFKDKTGQEWPAYGSGGLLCGRKIADAPETSGAPSKKRVNFAEYSSYEATPVTARHNLVPEDEEEEYVRTSIQFPETNPIVIAMPDGGCEITKYVGVRPKKENVAAFHTEDDDYSFGETISAPEKTVTKMPFLFQQVPDSHQIGITVFRTFDIDHRDAQAPTSLNLTRLYGPVPQACIYTGSVTEISANGKTFGHDINAFEGCSGAVVFLLDQNQPDDVDEGLYGLAVGIHSGGLDLDNHLAFLLPKI